MHIRTKINVDEGEFVVSCIAANTTDGTENPSIFQAEIADAPLIIDGEHAKEGELVLTQEKYDESELDESGNLIVKPYNDDADKYYLDGVELKYFDDTNNIQQVIIHPQNSLILNLQPKLEGTIIFNDCEHSILGGYFELYCRVTLDGLYWNDWMTLNDFLLAEEEIKCENNIELQIKIQNTGNTDVTFTYFNISGLITLNTFDAPTLSGSIFNSLLGTEEQIKLEVNLFKKLYFRGILPQYITRAENRSYKEDEDFVIFFKSVARFYSLLIRLFKRWENWRNDVDMLREQLNGYGIYFDENSTTLEELQKLCESMYSTAQQRGTAAIYHRKDEELPIDGEFIRLARIKAYDELLYDYIPKQNVGWCVGQGSPMYAGTCQSYNLNKTLENTKDFQSLANITTSVSGYGNISLQNVDSKEILKLQTKSNSGAAIGRLVQNKEAADTDILYIADSQLDYEITFAILKTVDTFNTTLNFGVEGFNSNKIKLNDAFIEPNGTVVNETFFSIPLTKLVKNEWYYVRGIIHAYNTANRDKITTNLGFGTDLYFGNSFVKYMLPYISLMRGSSTSEIEPENSIVYIWDYKIRPLIRGRNILPLKNGELDYRSLGFVDFNRFYYTYFRNKNNTRSVDDVTSIIEKYLYPFNNINLFTITGNKK